MKQALARLFRLPFERLIAPLLRGVSRVVIRYIEQPTLSYRPLQFIGRSALERCLKPGDVVLIEGNQRISIAIKYLTQSTWSHAAFYIGYEPGLKDRDGAPANLIEVDLTRGVEAVSIAKYIGFNMRICRPAKLNDKDKQALVQFMCDAIGNRYDIKNVVDLARYVLPQPPVPLRHRRKMIALGSGEPSRAICSTLIAQAFQSIRYPILPRITRENAREVHHIRHHSLFVPRDFDLSPYFRVIKPTLESGEFDYRKIIWSRVDANAPAAASAPALPPPAAASRQPELANGEAHDDADGQANGRKSAWLALPWRASLRKARSR